MNYGIIDTQNSARELIHREGVAFEYNLVQRDGYVEAIDARIGRIDYADGVLIWPDGQRERIYPLSW